MWYVFLVLIGLIAVLFLSLLLYATVTGRQLKGIDFLFKPKEIEDAPANNDDDEFRDSPDAISHFDNSPSGIEDATFLDLGNLVPNTNFYEQIAELLEHALEVSPDQQSIRLKLIEAYYEKGNLDSFLKHSQVFREKVDDLNDADWIAILEMGRSLIPDHELFSSNVDSRDLDAPDHEKSLKYRRFGDNPEAKKAFQELTLAYEKLKSDPMFLHDLDGEIEQATGRPTPLLHASRLSKQNKGAQIYIKCEDISYKYGRILIHLIGQGYIAQRMQKKKIIFGAFNGREAVIAAQAAARFGLECEIYISAKRGRYRREHVSQVRLLGARLTETDSDIFHNDIRYEAIDPWLKDPEHNFLMLNLSAGPRPFPLISTDIQSIIGREARRQIFKATGTKPDRIFSRGGHSSDSIGFVEPFLPVTDIGITLVTYIDNITDKSEIDREAYSILYTHKQKEFVLSLLDDIEFPRVEREHQLLKATNRIDYEVVPLDQGIRTVTRLARSEGNISPMETACVLSAACEHAKKLKTDQSVLVLMSEPLKKALLTVSAGEIRI